MHAAHMAPRNISFSFLPVLDDLNWKYLNKIIKYVHIDFL